MDYSVLTFAKPAMFDHKLTKTDTMLEKLLDGGYLPTTVIRAGIRQQLRQRLTSIASTSNA